MLDNPTHQDRDVKITLMAEAMAKHAGIAWTDLENYYTLSLSKEMWRGHWMGMATVALDALEPSTD